MRLSFICLKNFKINICIWCIVNVGFLRGFILIGLNKINLDFILFWFIMRIIYVMLKSFFFLNWYKMMFVKYL